MKRNLLPHKTIRELQEGETLDNVLYTYEFNYELQSLPLCLHAPIQIKLRALTTRTHHFEEDEYVPYKSNLKVID